MEGQPLLVSWNGNRVGQPGDVGGVRVRRLGSQPGAAFPDGSAIGVLESFSHTSISGSRDKFPNRFEAFESYLIPISPQASAPACRACCRERSWQISQIPWEPDARLRPCQLHWREPSQQLAMVKKNCDVLPCLRAVIHSLRLLVGYRRSIGQGGVKAS